MKFAPLCIHKIYEYWMSDERIKRNFGVMLTTLIIYESDYDAQQRKKALCKYSDSTLILFLRMSDPDALIIFKRE